MTNIHDSGYKILFSNRTIFRQLMETFVVQPWVDQLDFDRAERVDKSFVSEHYKETESDLIYRLPWGDAELYVYVLLEFQSTVDRWMALRMLNYRSAEEVKSMLQKTFEEWYQQGRQAGFGKGFEEGIEEGIEKGIEEGVRRTALAMFAHGIDPAVISDVTGLSEDELNALRRSSPPSDDETC